MNESNLDRATDSILKAAADSERDRLGEAARSYMTTYESGLYKTIPIEIHGAITYKFCKCLIDVLGVNKSILDELHAHAASPSFPGAN